MLYLSPLTRLIGDFPSSTIRIFRFQRTAKISYSSLSTTGKIRYLSSPMNLFAHLRLSCRDMSTEYVTVPSSVRPSPWPEVSDTSWNRKALTDLNLSLVFTPSSVPLDDVTLNGSTLYRLSGRPWRRCEQITRRWSPFWPTRLSTLEFQSYSYLY